MIRAFHYADYQLQLRPKSRYPLRKFPLLRDFSQKLVSSLPIEISPGKPATFDDMSVAHPSHYLTLIKKGPLSDAASREMGFLWSENLWERGRRIVGSSLEAYETSVSGGHGFTLGGGAHHAGASKGRGFCIFNDIAVVALTHLSTFPNEQVAVLDCDVHQGDGTAEILSDAQHAFTVSLHGEKNYPFRKQESDLDIGLPDGCSDSEYIKEVDRALFTLNGIRKLGLLIYVAGADPFHTDRLGRLNLTSEGLLERDLRVYEWCLSHSVPVVTVFGGGYCEPIEQTVWLNLQTILACGSVFYKDGFTREDIPQAVPFPIPESSPTGRT